MNKILLFISLFLIYILLGGILRIVELDTPFNEMLDHFLNNESSIGSFVFTYSAIYQFLLIMLIAWALSSIVRIIFDEGYQKTAPVQMLSYRSIGTTVLSVLALNAAFSPLSILLKSFSGRYS